MQQVIIDAHNKNRNDLAMGNTPNYEPAVRMGTLRWDEELANLALLNARTCEFAHDQCRTTGEITRCILHPNTTSSGLLYLSIILF